MPDNKTQPTGETFEDYLARVEPAARRAEARRLDATFAELTGEPAELWRGGIVGYGRYDYAYASGRTGSWMRTGFAVRRTGLTLYLMAGVERYAELLARLGPHKTGASCLYVTRLDRIDEGVLRELLAASLQALAHGDIHYGSRA